MARSPVAVAWRPAHEAADLYKIFPARSQIIVRALDPLSSHGFMGEPGTGFFQAVRSVDVDFMYAAGNEVGDDDRFFFGDVEPLMTVPAPDEHAVLLIMEDEEVCGYDNGFECEAIFSHKLMQETWWQDHLEKCAQPSQRAAWADSERVRLRMNGLNHAPVTKWTETGYLKGKMPAEMFETLRDFLRDYQHAGVYEDWAVSACYVNHCTHRPPLMTHLPWKVKDYVFDTMRPIIKEWIGVSEPLEDISCYGIRTYTAGSMLRNHVDRTTTHAASVILAIAADTEELWPLEIVDHRGQAMNVTLVPGEMLLYESATLLHGRPAQFQGRATSNIFLHFRPQGWEAALPELHTNAQASARDAENLWLPGLRYSRQYEVPLGAALGGAGEVETLVCGPYNENCH
jgi:hypothetical protein